MKGTRTFELICKIQEVIRRSERTTRLTVKKGHKRKNMTQKGNHISISGAETKRPPLERTAFPILMYSLIETY